MRSGVLRNHLLILSLVIIVTGSISADELPKSFYDPIEQNIEGWSVSIDPDLLEGEHAKEGQLALTMLANHLQRINILIPDKPLAELHKIGIWIEWENPKLAAMQYHPNKQWLINNGHDSRLAKMVHIPRARALYSREQMLKHPAVVLHELAHAYHDQVLGFDHPELLTTFQKAKDRGIYEKVLLFTGQTVPHYGLNNHKEYFAEGTEAYFYRNDLYPFVRAELNEFDPEFHEILRDIWSDQ
ncbi:metallopeptidase [uncultured Rubinisphaera sp.]|uniref:metallopeptidase n=1 Tax=uncultured Rubinisphaera sp. TaxID=1678686 RepID=UPI0030D9F958|tara:strand:+ start:868 stop:1593 length:726 start_codon:yes stop_codon:yes gene_type:complete